MGIYFYKQVFYIKKSKEGDPKVTLALWEMNKKMQFKACAA